VNFSLKEMKEMKVSSNIGIINALVRITIGFTLLAWTTAKLVKRPWRKSYLLVAAVAAMKIGEGFLKYCPVTDLMGRDSDKGMNMKDMFSWNKKDEHGGHEHHNQHEPAKHTPVHPEPHQEKKSEFNPEQFSNDEVAKALKGGIPDSGFTKN